MKKRILSFVLLLAIAVGILPIFALAGGTLTLNGKAYFSLSKGNNYVDFVQFTPDRSGLCVIPTAYRNRENLLFCPKNRLCMVGHEHTAERESQGAKEGKASTVTWHRREFIKYAGGNDHPDIRRSIVMICH